MSNALENFDFLELGQAIQDAREKQRNTREELVEELGISARHLQSVEKEGQYPSFRLFIQLVTMFHISVDQYIHPDTPTGKTTLRRRLDVLLDTCEVAAGTHHTHDKEQHEQGKPDSLQRPVDVNDDFPYRTALKGFWGLGDELPYLG